MVVRQLTQACKLSMLTPPPPFANRRLHNNLLTALDMGLFDANTALTQL